MLEAKEIFKSYNDKVIISSVNIALKPGQITAIIGPSGMGKSTLLRTLSFLDPPDKGTITLDGTTYDFPAKQNDGNLMFPWPKLTVVFQQLFLWPHLSIRQNITLPLQEGGQKNSQQGHVDELIKLFEMQEFVDRFPNQVSLGQRQRAAIARALALNPKYLLLDEITSALDVEHVSILLNYLKTLREQGTAILIITHLIGFAKRAADKIIFMDQGQILEAGGSEILTTPKSERLMRFLSLVDTAL